MADEEAKILQEAKKLPVEDRLAHKNWKVRNAAYIDIASICDSITDPKDPRLKEFGPLFKKSVSDANAPAQEKALDALIAFQKAADAEAGRYAKEICDAIAAKCLTGRTKTVEKANIAFMLWVELEAVEAFMDAMDKAVKSKVAKAVVPAVEAIFDALSGFGIKIVPPKRVLKILPELFNHADEKVRAVAKALAVELTKWIGKDAVKRLLFDGLREATQKELEAEIDKVEGLAVPARRIRSEMDKIEPESEELSTEQGSGPEAIPDSTGPIVVDEYELCDPVDILTPLGKTTFWEGIGATKWSERKEAVAELTKLSSTKRIAPGDFVPVTRALKKLIVDINIAVSVEAIQAAGCLASGLRRDYFGGAQMLLPVLLDKLKEKKPSVVAALRETLRNMFRGGCFSFPEMTEDVKVAVKNKVPSARSEALLWVAECIEYSKTPELLKIHKDYVAIMMEALQDTTPEVRDAAFLGLANMAKVVGMKPLERSLEKLDDVRKKKLSELIATTAPTTSHVAQNDPPAAAVVSRSDASGASQTGSSKSAAAAFLNKRPGVRPPTSSSKAALSTDKSASGKARAGAVAATDDKEEKLEVELTPDEVEEKAAVLLNAELLTNLKSAQWKERLEGMTALKDLLETWSADHDAGVLILISLVSNRPGWADKNFQVLQKLLEVVTLVAQRASHFPKSCAHLCIPGIVEKVGDIKTRLQAQACLTAIAEAVGPRFVFEKAYDITNNSKNPKVLTEVLLWFAQAVEDFGVAPLNVKALVDFCKDPGLLSSTGPCRSAATKALGILHKYLGPDLKAFLNDVKPAQMALLDTEFAKNPLEVPPPEPTRTVKSNGNANIVGGNSAGNGVGSVAGISTGIAVGSISDLLPREDISSKLTTTLIESLGSHDWKVRQESLDAVDKIVEEAHKRIQPTGTGELFAALRGRLFDTNKNLITMALTILGNLALAMGTAIDKASKGIMTDILKCLSDPKKQMREAVIRTLDAWMTAVPLDKLVDHLFIWEDEVFVLGNAKIEHERGTGRTFFGKLDLLPYLPAAIMDAKVSADGRKELLEWLTKQVSKASEISDMFLLMKPCVAGLQDKSSDVRKATEGLLLELVKVSSPEVIMKAARGELTASTLPVIGGILDKHRPIPDTADDGGSQKHGSGRTIPTRSTHGGAVAGGLKSSVTRNRTVIGGNVQGRTLKQSTVDLLQDAAAQGQPLFNLRESIKEEREKIIPRGVKMKFEVPGADQAQDLEEDIRKFFREDLARRLCSKDFKLQVEGLDMLRKAIPEYIREMEEVLDLILRWSVFRMCESNTTGLLKVLDFLHDLFENLKKDGFMLTECEANMFVPCLVEKSGHNIANVREKMRELMRLICNVCPASKILIYVVDGVRSKNNRTRVQCVEYIEAMIERYGIGVMGGSKVPLVAVAALTVERDTEIRKGALNTLSTAYKILGDDIWKQMGKLSDAQKSLLEDKFRWKAREMEKRKEGLPGGRGDTQRLKEEGWPNGNTDQTSQVQSIAGALFVNRDLDQMEPGTWKEAMECVASTSSTENMEQVVEGLKWMCTELSRITEENDLRAMVAYAEDADALIVQLTVLVTRTFTLSMQPGQSSRPCKYVLNTLVQVFQITPMGHAVTDAHLQSLIADLLIWLLDERVHSTSEDGPNLLRALNVLMLKILDHARPTSALAALIGLLRPPQPGEGPSPAAAMSTDDFLGQRGNRFSDLVVRCLIKLTKSLGQRIDEVDLGLLLLKIHEYLQVLSMDEIRRRAGTDDKPFRMVKTVLHEVCKVVGPGIMGHLSLVPIDANPSPIILAYINMNLQTMAGKRIATPVRSAERPLWRDDGSAYGTQQSPGGALDDNLREQLRSVLQKIGDKSTSADGLYELHSIMQQNPEVDIVGCFSTASQEMQRYIQEGLAQVEREISAGREGGTAVAGTLSDSSASQQSTVSQAGPQVVVTQSDVNGEANGESGVGSGRFADGKMEMGSLDITKSQTSGPRPPNALSGGSDQMASSYPSSETRETTAATAWNTEDYREQMRLIATEVSPVQSTTTQVKSASSNRINSSLGASSSSSQDVVTGSGFKARLGQFKSRKAAEPYM